MTIEEQWAYIAGLIDGEGSFSINPRIMKNDVVWWRYHIRIGITARQALSMCQKVTGFGAIRKENRPTRTGKTVWCWTIYGREAAQTCKHLLPYLLIKKRHAEILIEFSETMGDNGKKPSVETFRQRQRLYKEIVNRNNGKRRAKFRVLNIPEPV